VVPKSGPNASRQNHTPIKRHRQVAIYKKSNNRATRHRAHPKKNRPKNARRHVFTRGALIRVNNTCMSFILRLVVVGGGGRGFTPPP
jgi:hypothetical protein